MDPFPAGTPPHRLLERIRESVPALGLVWSPGRTSSIVNEILRLSAEALLGRRPADPDMAAALRSGLLLRADRFDEPHSICQDIPSATGSYWHGILHRREPDFDNARYWFRRVGKHPVFAPLREAVADLKGSPEDSRIVKELSGKGAWDPIRWIDRCEACAEGGRAELRPVLVRIQEIEVDLLLRHSYLAAIGDPPASDP